MRTLLLKSLFARPVTLPAPSAADVELEATGRALEDRARRLFGRAITIREVDAGSCNGCELEIHALNNAVYDVERFGIRFAASPRHCDVLMVTGPV
ncbi:MAG TPA: formate hydrogenlyase, partial [Caldimonas sp.]|nr:formate hydrogenlyase [Caldimonas sp.]